MKQWHVVHCHTSSEIKAVVNLERQGFECYLPFYTKSRRHARRVDQVKVPLFPRYLFVRFDRQADRWRSINSTIGVNRLISNGEDPVPIADVLIDDIRSRENDQGVIKINLISPPLPGEAVQVIGGPMLDHSGIFECEKDNDRVVILLNLIGRDVRVTLHSELVVSAA
jgi:transcriptional antiterminator RfaH